MKKTLKFIFISLSVLFIFTLGAFIYTFSVTFNHNIDINKLEIPTNNCIFLDSEGKELFTSQSKKTVEIKKIPDHVKNAFISVEDKRFYKHNGIDAKAMLRAFLKNIKSFSFKEGGSTISQQLIKNTHLTNNKTLKRKLIEFKLTKQLEKKYSKDKILEMYLNSIYFGSNTYGIENASQLYFGKNTIDLTVSESALLAGIIKGPSAYSPLKNLEKSIKRRDLILKLMLDQNLIIKTQYESAKNEKIILKTNEKSNFNDYYIKKAQEEFDEIIKNSPYKIKNCKIYTNLQTKMQENLYKNAEHNLNYTGVVIDKNSNICAYYSNTFDDKRQAGSSIKPIAVYAPAIEENIVSECTPILDEKTTFNGYSPKNYGDKYKGYISVNESLACSSNVCAVKLLNYLTPKKSIEYMKKMNFNVNNDDANLSLALGSTKNGQTLLEIVNSYNVFINNGQYKKAKFIDKIYINDKIFYENNQNKVKIFSEDTCQMINLMCENTVKTGTAKKLNTLNMPLASKTGTVGTNNGNTDAYSISYTPNYTLGIKISGEIGNITGGGLPTQKAYEFWSENQSTCQFNYDKLSKQKIDLISYKNENKLILADDISPERYYFYGYFRKNQVPKERSTRFSNPIVENLNYSVNNNVFNVSLCQTEYTNYQIIKRFKNIERLIYDSKNNSFDFSDKMTEYGEYEYFVIPYTEINGDIYYGEKYKIGKFKNTFDDDIWWEN